MSVEPAGFPMNVYRAAPVLHADFGSALAHCALIWHQQPDEQATAAAITRDARRLLGGVAAALVTVPADGHLEFRASCGPQWMLMAALPRLSVDAAARQRFTTVGDSGWPVSAAPGETGTGRMICAPLGCGREMFGTLLVLTTISNGPAATSTIQAATLAIHASLALAAARHHANLQAAISTRDLIGQAKGILMERAHHTAEQAYAQLLHTSQHTNTKLRQVAETLSLTGELPESAAACHPRSVGCT